MRGEGEVRGGERERERTIGRERGRERERNGVAYFYNKIY